MLPIVTLTDVSRDDVDRIAWWLEDRELSSRWLGHYGCGDPVHRGYDPVRMLEAAQWEWDSVFGDPNRRIYSIYNDKSEHIGECQLILNGHGDAELSLMIGRKDLWHHGFGTSTVLIMLDKVFGELGMDKAWVNLPEDNIPAMGLFEKFGFSKENTRELCRRADGSTFSARILAMKVEQYRRSRRGDHSRQSVPVITVTGLPGTGSEEVGKEIAKMLSVRFMDGEISEALCQRLMCTAAELEAFEGSYRSFWSRIMNSILVPMEWSATYDAGYQGFATEHMMDYTTVLQEHITKKSYLERLSRVIRRYAAEGNVVLHSHGSHLLIPSTVPALNVYITASHETRTQRIAGEQDVTAGQAGRWINTTDKETKSIFKNLFGHELEDSAKFDLTINMDRMTPKAAAEMIVGAIVKAASSIQTAVDAQINQAIGAALK
ncbi:MAG: GNAT family N-acetyltransferase [SAR202 cluster bacterium]|nr:GNAT family N-acetyltransferase [SAR202 cluster bacterium]